MKLSNMYLLCLLAGSALALPTSTSNSTETSLDTTINIKNNARVKGFTGKTSSDRACSGRPTNGISESLSKREGIVFDEEPDEWPKPKQLTGQILDERRCFENRQHQYLRKYLMFLAYACHFLQSTGPCKD